MDAEGSIFTNGLATRENTTLGVREMKKIYVILLKKTTNLISASFILSLPKLINGMPEMALIDSQNLTGSPNFCSRNIPR